MEIKASYDEVKALLDVIRVYNKSANVPIYPLFPRLLEKSAAATCIQAAFRNRAQVKLGNATDLAAKIIKL